MTGRRPPTNNAARRRLCAGVGEAGQSASVRRISASACAMSMPSSPRVMPESAMARPPYCCAICRIALALRPHLIDLNGRAALRWRWRPAGMPRGAEAMAPSTAGSKRLGRRAQMRGGRSPGSASARRHAGPDTRADRRADFAPRRRDSGKRHRCRKNKVFHPFPPHGRTHAVRAWMRLGPGDLRFCDEQRLRVSRHHHVRSDVAPRGRARRGQSGPGLSRRRRPARHSRSRGARDAGRPKPVSADARSARAAPGRGGALPRRITASISIGSAR